MEALQALVVEIKTDEQRQMQRQKQKPVRQCVINSARQYVTAACPLHLHLLLATEQLNILISTSSTP